ncbi:MAG: extracellular solute-binding protein [Hyphomicrobiales bacterium]|nr:extracellular solute-binding protein [Hyphomicrobiales bacterium]MBV8824038.1 extracellular solute-binding protein [Hyphomicrobiales bacterium]
MKGSKFTRRDLLKSTALATASVVGAPLAAPYVHGAYAAGKLSLGLWDHWVPGANDTLTKLCNEWGEKNKVEVHIDYITSQGEKDKLTAAAEAQARTGHDIMSHRDWNIVVHHQAMEPVNDVVGDLIKQNGPISPVAEYLANIDGQWAGVPTTVGSQVKPCCSRFDLYKQHAGIDLQDIFPNDESKYVKAKTDTWTWDTYLSSAEKLFKAGYPVGLPMGQTSDAVDWVAALFKSYGVVMVDEKSDIRINSPETRTALEYLKKLMAVNPPEVYAWDDAGNNRWLISGKGSSIMNPPSAWSVAKRDNPEVAKNCWTHAMPMGPKGRFVGQLPQFYGVWSFSQNKPAAKDLLRYISQKDSARRLVAASNGYDLPSFKSFYDFETWKTVEPPVGTVYSYPPRGDEQTSMCGAPARPDVAAQLYNQALPTVMVSKFTQGNEKLDDVIKWAEGELEGYLRS